MTSLNIITNITGFEHALEDIKLKEGPPITEVRLAVTRKTKEGELGASQTGPLLLIACNEADKWCVGVAIMSVFGQVPKEHASSARAREEKLLSLVERQTNAIEELVKVVRAK